MEGRAGSFLVDLYAGIKVTYGASVQEGGATQVDGEKEECTKRGRKDLTDEEKQNDCNLENSRGEGEMSGLK